MGDKKMMKGGIEFEAVFKSQIANEKSKICHGSASRSLCPSVPLSVQLLASREDFLLWLVPLGNANAATLFILKKQFNFCSRIETTDGHRWTQITKVHPAGDRDGRRKPVFICVHLWFSFFQSLFSAGSSFIFPFGWGSAELGHPWLKAP